MEFEKLYNENIEIGDILSLNPINNKVYKSNLSKKDRIIGICKGIKNEKIKVINCGSTDINFTGIACIGDKVTISEIPGKGRSIKYNQEEDIFNIRSIGKIIGLYDNYNKVKILLDIE